jgi:hypothetical protein
MPTKLPRHSITETPAVKAALDELRRETGEARVSLGELVILGAEEKTRRLRVDLAEDRKRLDRLADRILGGDLLIDTGAAEHVRRTGWIRE